MESLVSFFRFAASFFQCFSLASEQIISRIVFLSESFASCDWVSVLVTKLAVSATKACYYPSPPNAMKSSSLRLISFQGVKW